MLCHICAACLSLAIQLTRWAARLVFEQRPSWKSTVWNASSEFVVQQSNRSDAVRPSSGNLLSWTCLLPYSGASCVPISSASTPWRVLAPRPAKLYSEFTKLYLVELSARNEFYWSCCNSMPLNILNAYWYIGIFLRVVLTLHGCQASQWHYAMSLALSQPSTKRISAAITACSQLWCTESCREIEAL